MKTFQLVAPITGFVDLKMDGSDLNEKSFFKMLRLSCSSKLDLCSYNVSFTETTSKKIRAMTSSVNFFSEVTL